MAELNLLPHECDRAVVVGVIENKEKKDLAEIGSLLSTLKIKVVGEVLQKHSRPTAAYLLSAGKMAEVAELVEEQKANLVVIDNSLAGPQAGNLTNQLCCQVIDRKGIILEIFARHAKSSRASTQVEIAQLNYLLPQLTGAWTHFQRQKGGGVHSRGMGETQIEIDRRRVRERLSRLRRKLAQIKNEASVQRKSRLGMLRIALVGYTNSGKTSLMAGLTNCDISGRNELFATLDASVRNLAPTTRPRILLSDTVGFIQNLPKDLFESFRSTLEEVCDADLLLHVIDISHPDCRSHIKVTEEVLTQIGADQVPSIMLFNKADRIDDSLQARILTKAYPGCRILSAHREEDLNDLRQHLYTYFSSRFTTCKIRIAANNSKILSIVHQHCIIEQENYEKGGVVEFNLRAPAQIYGKLIPYIISDPTTPQPAPPM